jgi:RNA polymerase sigma-70 factor (ECF subfamily)
VALTLRSVCGLTTAQIAAAFLDAEPTMGQRLSRAKAKIAAAGIPFAVPAPEDWPARLDAVLTVVYLVFTTGYAAGPSLGIDLGGEALFLARLIDRLSPDRPEIEGCLALILLTHARRAARVDTQGASVAIADQDRGLWDRALIDEGMRTLERALSRRRPGPFQLKAAIAACHVAEDGPDWPQIAELYDRLHALEPGPVIALNRAVARMEAGQLSQALEELVRLAATLDAYQPYHAARAEMLHRAGCPAESDAAYARAIALAPTSADAAFLDIRRSRAARSSASAPQTAIREKKGRAEARPKSNREV